MNVEVDRLQINYLLDQLTQQWDGEAARKIIDSFKDIPLSTRGYELLANHREKDSVTGFTQEHGNITLESENNKSKTIGEDEDRIIRIGNFKVQRFRGPEFESISFYHFWKSNLITKGSVFGPRWLISYNSDFEPVRFMIFQPAYGRDDFLGMLWTIASDKRIWPYSLWMLKSWFAGGHIIFNPRVIYPDGVNVSSYSLTKRIFYELIEFVVLVLGVVFVDRVFVRLGWADEHIPMSLILISSLLAHIIVKKISK